MPRHCSQEAVNGMPAVERQPDRVLLVGCSPGWGLTYYNAVLALAMKKAGVPVVVLSSTGEMSSGLHENLRAADIPVIDEPSMEAMDFSAIRRAGEVIASCCVPGSNILHTEGTRHAIAGWLAKRRTPRGTELAVTAMISAMGNARRLWPVYYAIGTAILNATSERILLLCSRELERMTRFGLRRSKSDVQYFFVDAESFEGGPNADDRFAPWAGDSRLLDANLTKVVYLAQFGRHKNHIPLLRAWVQVVERIPNMLLVLAGYWRAPSKRQEVRERARHRAVSLLSGPPAKGGDTRSPSPVLLRGCDFSHRDLWFLYC